MLLATSQNMPARAKTRIRLSQRACASMVLAVLLCTPAVSVHGGICQLVLGVGDFPYLAGVAALVAVGFPALASGALHFGWFS